MVNQKAKVIEDTLKMIHLKFQDILYTDYEPDLSQFNLFLWPGPTRIKTDS